MICVVRGRQDVRNDAGGTGILEWPASELLRSSIVASLLAPQSGPRRLFDMVNRCTRRLQWWLCYEAEDGRRIIQRLRRLNVQVDAGRFRFRDKK